MSNSQKRKTYLKNYWQSDKGKASQKRYRQSEKGKLALKRYNQSKKGKTNHLKANIRHYRLYPERLESRRAVNNAIRDRELPRPDLLQCFCGEPAKHYHHYKGYSKEHHLDVVPVCKKCHIIIDKKIA